MTPRPIRVGLLWHTLGHPNLGVDALTRANIAILNKAATQARVAPEFLLLGTPGPHAPNIENVRQGPRFSPKRILTFRSDFLKALRSCDAVFDISEGDSFADIYGRARFLQQSATKAAVLAARVPLILSPQTIGPFRAPWARAIAGSLLKRSRRVYARDDLSTRALYDLGRSANADEVIDVAFALPYERSPAPSDGITRVGINVSGLLFNGGYTGKNEFGLRVDYPALTRELVHRFATDPSVELWLVPHVLAPGKVDSDLLACSTLASEFPNALVAPPFPDSVAAKSFISGLDYFVGARMHACIAAFSSGVPVTPIAYSRKFNGLFGTLGYSHLVDGLQHGTTEACAIVEATYTARRDAKAQIEGALTIATARLQRYQDAASDLFREIAAGG